MENLSNNQIRESVMESYKNVALSNSSCGCDTTSCCSPSETDVLADVSKAMGYSDSEYKNVPEGSNMGLGCGNPQAIASLKEGEVVLDLGSGGGFDSFLSSNSVGETGKVIGVDMTPEMVSKARANAEKGGFKNIYFRLGEIEHLPVADSTIDVIISNCVINLSPEKDKVFSESFRVLKPGGRLAISDIVSSVEIPEDMKKDLSLYSACVTGASSIDELKILLDNSGFSEIKIEPKDTSREFIKDWAPDKGIENYVISASIEAIKKV